MLAQPSNNYNQYNHHYANNGPIIQSSPLLYQQHSISRSENLNVQPLPTSYNNQQQPPPVQQHQHQQEYRSEDSPAPAAQNFLSTFFRDHHQFISPISHTRPYFQAGEPFSTTPRVPRLTAHRSVDGLPKAASAFDSSILGSGDFGVLRGGTFYQDNDPTLFRSSESSNEFSYYNKNGHGRPQTAAYVQRYTYPEDQFANFRDFADINTPSDASYSHFVVVYMNRNGSVVESPYDGDAQQADSDTSVDGGEEQQQQRKKSKYEPRNILDQLRLLDDEDKRSTTTTKRTVKLSKSKAKLKRTKLTRMVEKKKKDSPKEKDFEDVLEDTHRIDIDQIDPLLALS